MKKTILNIAAIVMLLFVAIAANAAGTVKVVKTLNGVVSTDTALGSVSQDIVDGTCTITVEPGEAYYVNTVTAVALIDAGQAQARKNEPGFNPTIGVEHGDAENTWVFTMPEDNNYDVEVTVDFLGKTDISTAVVTLSLPAEGYTYTGEEYEPEVTLVKLGDLEIESDYYDVSYSNNTDAGTATVTVTGKDIYMGEATATFTINRAALSELSVEIDGWTYGEYDEEDNAPYIQGNEGEGAETVLYKAQGADDETYTDELPTDAGNYTVKVEVAETDNYQAGSATANFTIEKAYLTDDEVTVSITGWTYGDDPNAPSVEGAPADANVQYAYFTVVDDEDVELEEVPTNAGAYTIKATISSSKNFYGITVEDEFSIDQADFSEVVIANIANQTYTGDPIEPAVSITFNDSPVDASEYEVNYGEDNVDAGTVTLEITSKNVNFTVSENPLTKTFQIVAAQVEITAEDQTVTYDGTEQEFNNFEGDDVEVVALYYDSESDRTAGENQLEVVVNAGTYYVKLVSGDDNYAFDPVYATFTIEPKNLEDLILMPEGNESIIFDGTPKTLMEYGLIDVINNEEYGLEEGNEDGDNDFTVAYTNNINVGTATATFTGHGNYTGTVTKNFEIVRDLEINFDGHNWVTYYGAENLATPDGLQAYKVTEIGATEVTTAELTYIPANTAVLLKKTKEEVESYLAKAYTGQASEVTENLLQGASIGIDVTTISTGVVYVLYNDEFVKTISGEIPAGRGYLVVASSAAPSGPEARALTITIDEKATGITAATVAAKADGKYYNLQGQRMAQPRKGLNIVNGKKFMVK